MSIIIYFYKLVTYWSEKMEVSYNKLWKLLIDRHINKSNLRLLTGIGTNTLANLVKTNKLVWRY